MPFKLAVIGLGKIAQDQHLPAIAKNRDFELTAVVSSRAPYKDVPSFKTPAELFASDLEVDAVSLCMPPEARIGIARDSFDAGLHVLMEKPPAPTMGELVAIAAYAAQAKRVVFTTWHSRYNAAVDEAKKLLTDKTVKKLHVSWKEDVRRWHPGQEWIWEPGGFGVFDPGINAFSIITKILPKPIFVSSCTLETPSNRQTPIAAQIRFKPSWRGAAELSADLDWHQTGEQTWNISVETTDGQLLELRRGGTEMFLDGKLHTASVETVLTSEYEGIYQHFARLLNAEQSHIDSAPLQLVSDCFMLGRRVETEAFV
jgi:D-galactose 1-dehydrogenase